MLDTSIPFIFFFFSDQGLMHQHPSKDSFLNVTKISYLYRKMLDMYIKNPNMYQNTPNMYDGYKIMHINYTFTYTHNWFLNTETSLNITFKNG